MIHYFAIFTTGLCSLIYQVVWQRYLTLILGSEARSTTIIVALFLLGLAIGYYFFGQLTQKFRERAPLLKTYGFLELITGAYAVVFPTLFWGLAETSLGLSPYYGVNIFFALVLLILPTILMGATIPIMTTVLPHKNSEEEVNRIHRRIYGLNTLGGFLGVLLGSFYFVPELGLAFSLSIVGLINVLVSLLYIGNRLKGEITIMSTKRDDAIVSVPFPVLCLWSFISGAVVIALEILWFRIVGLTIGSSHLVFPFVLSLFIAGLGIGSLSSKVKDIKSFKHQLIISLGFLILSFVVAPWLPWLISHWRVMLVTFELNYYAFYLGCYLIFAFIILPFAIPMGRVLPAIFMFTPKVDRDFGKKCGQIYFINTLGTFLGATFFAYLLFYLFDFPSIFKQQIFLYALILITLYYILKEKNKALILFVLLLIGLSILPFSRRFHSQSTFRVTALTQGLHQTAPWNAWPRGDEIEFLTDDPDMTVAVMRFGKGEDISKSIFVNGKSDSNTRGDHGTLVLSALIPYLYINHDRALKTSIVGAGTGVTASRLNLLDRVSEVHLVEISSGVIRALEYFDEINTGFLTSPKLSIHQMDAFRYYRGLQEKHDVIVSEPTNPWTVGVENLYTRYFYRLIRDRLAEDGVFYQWFNLYATSPEIFMSVLKNMREFFPHIHIYQTLNGDAGIVASTRSLRIELFDQKIKETQVSAIFREIGMHPLDKIQDTKDMFHLLKRFNTFEVDALLKTEAYFDHDVDYPQINYRSLKNFFLNDSITSSSLRQLISFSAAEITNSNSRRREAFYQILSFSRTNPNFCEEWRGQYQNLACALIYPVLNLYERMQAESTPIHERKRLYQQLRRSFLLNFYEELEE